MESAHVPEGYAVTSPGGAPTSVGPGVGRPSTPGDIRGHRSGASCEQGKMLDPHVPFPDVPHASADLLDLHGRPALEALRVDAGVIHRRLRRITEHAAAGTAPSPEDLDRVAVAVSDLHRRILELSHVEARASLDDVVAARRSIHRSLALVREVADDVRAV